MGSPDVVEAPGFSSQLFQNGVNSCLRFSRCIRRSCGAGHDLIERKGDRVGDGGPIFVRAASLGVSHLLNELQIVFIAAELILRNGFNAGNVAKAAS